MCVNSLVGPPAWAMTLQSDAPHYKTIVVVVVVEFSRAAAHSGGKSATGETAGKYGKVFIEAQTEREPTRNHQH